MTKDLLKILCILSCIALVVWLICYYFVSRDILGERIYIAVYAVPMLCYAIWAQIKNDTYYKG